MTAPTAVLEARLALALACIAALQDSIAATVAPVTYGRRVGDRLADYGDRVHFSDVYELVGVADSRDDHGTNITDSLFTTGKAA